jgi:hypothetical protein
MDCSTQFARRVLGETEGSFKARLGRAFALAYGRPPEKDEVALFQAFGASDANRDQTPEKLWTAICHALLSSNEFLYVD